MGYAKGRKWCYQDMCNEVYKVMETLDINRMPTASECNLVVGNTSLSNVIAKRGGFLWLADKLGLEQSKCESRLGLKGELMIKEILEQKGYKVEKMKNKHPYDLLVNKNVKIDIKASNLYTSPKGWTSYSFNLEKDSPTCDIYVIICNGMDRILVIPSKFLTQTQLCITGDKSKYDIYKDRWDYIEQYDVFYKSVS